MRQGVPDREQVSPTKDMLRGVARFVSRTPRFTLLLVIISAFLSVGFAATHLLFKTDRSDLIDPEAPFQKRWARYAEEFGDATDIVIAVEGQNVDAIRKAVDDLGGKMHREPESFQKVLYRFDSSKIKEKGLLLAPPDVLEKTDEMVSRMAPVARGGWAYIRLDSLFDKLRGQIEATETSDNKEELKPLIFQSRQLAESMTRYMNSRDDYESPWKEIGLDDTSYLMNDRRTMAFIRAQPIRGEGNFGGRSSALDRLEELIKGARAAHPEVTIGATGIPLLEREEMKRSQADMTWASILSFAGVGLLMFLAFRGFRHPFIALLMLAVAMCWAFAFTTASIGHLNILSVSFATMLIGMGIDFAIHFLSKYLSLRHEGRQLRPALVETSGTVGTGILAGAVTTALAFFAATFTPFRGVSELGLIAGGGILLCALAAFVVMPSTIALADKDVDHTKLPKPMKWNFCRRFIIARPAIMSAIFLIGALALSVQAFRWTGGIPDFKVKYDHNLLNLQADKAEPVEVQKRIVEQSDTKVLFAVAIADSPEQARELRRKFRKLPTVRGVEDLAARLNSSNRRENRAILDRIHAKLTLLPQSAPQLPIDGAAGVGGAMIDLRRSLEKLKSDEAQTAVASIQEFLKQFGQMRTHSSQVEFLNAYQTAMTTDLWGRFRGLAYATDPTTKITVEELPAELTSRFVSPKGKWLLQIYPKEHIWDFEPLEAFVNDIRSVDPEVTGTPLQNYEASRQIKLSYEIAALLALVIVVIVLLVDYIENRHLLAVFVPPLIAVGFGMTILQMRGIKLSPTLLAGVYVVMCCALAAVLDWRNLRDVFLSMAPPVLGGLMTFGILAIAKIPLNPANLIVLPLILGVAVDYGVHVVHDFREQLEEDYSPSGSMFTSLILTSLTTMAGFGSMMFASHRGLFSIGLVLCIGVGCSVLVALVLVPALLAFLSRNDSVKDTGVGKGGNENSHDGRSDLKSNRPQQPQKGTARVA